MDDIITELKKEIDEKDNEISGYIDKIENLEDELMKLHELMSEEPSKKKSKKIKESKLQIELDAKDREIRELKDRMGFLRMDKLEAERKLDNINISSSVIRVEDLREKAPLNILVKELQDKINKQESLIRKLKRQNTGKNEFDEILEEKDEVIENLNLKLSELTEKLQSKKSVSDTTSKINIQSGNTISKGLLEELQNKLNKTKRENNDLRKKVEIYEDKNKSNNQIKNLKDKISELQSKLETKESEIEKLKEDSIQIDQTSGPTALKQVVEELQNKLKKSKSQISILQDQLSALGNEKEVPRGDIDSKLKIQREMASFLQQQLDDTKRILKVKDEEITTIKNEAIRIKRSYEELENQLRFKDNKITELKNELEQLSIAVKDQNQHSQVEKPQLSLRIQELKTIIEDLTKQNIQQRLEIDQLRKNM